MTDIDCLIVGNNQMQFQEYADTLRATGEGSGAYRDIRLSFYRDTDQRTVTCRDFVNRRAPGTGPEMSYDDMLSATVTYLGSYLHRRGHTFGYVNSFQEGRAALAGMLREHRVRAVAVTTTYYVSPLPLLEVVNFVRSIDPAVRIIVGGPFVRTQHELHTTSSFEFLLRRIGADFYVISQQGEQTLALLLDALRDGAPFQDIPNLVYRDGDGYTRTPLVHEDNDLATEAVDWGLFAEQGPRGCRRMVMVRTAQSCPFSCTFCSFPVHAGAYRYLDPAQVLHELDEIEALGCVNSVTFIDDTFNVPTGRFKRLLEEMRKRRYSFRWNCNFRCQYATPDIVGLMKQAGCEGVFLGLESASDPILAMMNKRATARAYKRGVELLRDAGILTHASFIVGFPGETEETVLETTNFIEQTRPDFFRAQLWYYDTMTPVHADAAALGLRNSQFEWSHSTMNAAEAADWVDHLHATVEGSVWLPQNDFDFPSLFCLLSRGWSPETVKAAVRKFDDRVRQGLGGHLDRELLRESAFGFPGATSRSSRG